MKCVDCIEKEVKAPDNAEIYLINQYESVKPLCQSCYDEYAYMEGSLHLDSYSVEISGVGQFEFIKRINEVLKYQSTMIQKYSDGHFKAKKMGEDCQRRDVKIAPHALLEAIKW